MFTCIVVVQVLDWLANHGEVFLRKNIGIGRNLQKARVYQKSHEHFENVAQVSTHIILLISSNGLLYSETLQLYP